MMFYARNADGLVVNSPPTLLTVTGGRDSGYCLTVARGGAGSGTVTGISGGISCGTACTGPYAAGTQITLTATADTGSTFAGWSGGGCSGTGACTVTMDAGKTVTANFTVAGALLGDINNDGAVTIADAILVCRSMSGLPTTGQTIAIAADVNGDGRIGLAEVIYILQKLAGLR